MRHAVLALLLSAALVMVGLDRPVAASNTMPGPPLTYVAIGASDAVGIGALDPAREGWVPQLTMRLGPDTRVHNLGVSGSLLRDALHQQLPAALEVEADLVTVWVAVNDFNALVPLGEYEQDLDQLLGALRARSPRAQILVGNVPDVTRVARYTTIEPFFLDWIRWEVTHWNQAIDTVAARHGARVVDLSAGWAELVENPDYISEDGFHPSARGYARLAELFYGALEERALEPDAAASG